VKLAGDAIYGQNSWLPQLALGAEFKRHGGIEHAGPLVSPKQLGAKDDDGPGGVGSDCVAGCQRENRCEQ